MNSECESFKKKNENTSSGRKNINLTKEKGSEN